MYLYSGTSLNEHFPIAVTTSLMQTLDMVPFEVQDYPQLQAPRYSIKRTDFSVFPVFRLYKVHSVMHASRIRLLSTAD